MAGKSTFNQRIAAKICDELLEGKSLVSICAQEGFPARSTVFKWLSENASFSDSYARAKELQMEAMGEEILSIADDGLNDTLTDEEGHTFTNHDVINRSRLRVDTRKWLMSKLAPKKYGDKVQQEVSGPGGKPIQAEVTVQFVRPTT